MPGPSFAQVDPLEIDYERDPRFLPYEFTDEFQFDYGITRPTIGSSIQVLSHSLKTGDDALIVIARNGPYNSGEVASFLVKNVTTSAVLSEDPVWSIIRDFAITEYQEDGSCYLVGGSYHNDSAFVIRNRPGTNQVDMIYLTSGKDRSGDDQWMTGVSVVGQADYDFDGREEIFLYVAPGRDIEPRILACVQVEPFQVEWNLPMSTVIGEAGFHIGLDTASPAVIFCSYGPQNGAKDAAFDDYYGYLTRIDNRGSIVFSHRILADFGGPEIIAIDSLRSQFCFYHNIRYDPSDSAQPDLATGKWLSIIDKNGKLIKTTAVDRQVVSMWMDEYSGHECIFSLWSGGVVRNYDPVRVLRAESGATNLGSYVNSFRIAGVNSPVRAFNTIEGVTLYSRTFDKLAVHEQIHGVLGVLSYGSDSTTTFVSDGSNAGRITRLSHRSRWAIIKVAFWEYQEALLIVLLILTVGLVITNRFRMRAVTKLAERERTLQSLFDSMQDSAYRADLEGRLVWVSPSCVKLLGATERDQIIGKLATDFYVNPTKRQDLLNALVENGRVTDFEVEARGIDGREIVIGISSTFYYDKSGKVAGIEGVFRDITARRKMENALRLSEEQYRGLVENAGQAIFTVDHQGTFLFMNSVAAQRLGGAVEQFIGRRVTDLFPPEVGTRHLKSILGVFENGQATVIDSTTVLRGKTHEVSTSLAPIRDPQGRIESVLCISRDMSELVQIRRRLTTQEEFTGSLMDAAKSLIVCLDVEGRVTICNRETERVTGHRRDKIGGMLWTDLVWARGGRVEGSTLTEWLNNPGLERIEAEVRGPDGHQYSILWSKSTIRVPGSGETRKLLIGQDITDRKQHEEYIRLLSSAVEQSSEGIGVTDLDGSVILVNEAMARMHGYAVSEILGCNVRQFYKVEQLEGLEKSIQHIQTTGRFTGEFLQTRKDGTVFPAIMSNSILRDGAGLGIGIIATIIDISAIKRAEERVRLLSSAMEQSSEGLAVVDLEGNIISLNEAFATMHGYTSEELIGKNLEIYHNAEQMSAVRAAVMQMKTTGSFSGEMWHTRKDGTVFPGLMNNSLLRDASGDPVGMIGTLIDITDRKQAEETLRHRVEIEALVASISTDFINMSVEQIDDGITKALTRVGKYFEADRGYLLCLDDRRASLPVTHEYLAEGVESVAERASALRFEEFPWWIGKLRRFEHVAVARLSDLPDEASAERRLLEMIGTKSVLVVPLVMHGRWFGALQFAWLKKYNEFPAEDIRMLGMIGEIFVNALDRKKTALEIEQVNQEILEQERQIAGGFAHEIRNALFPARGMLDKLTSGLPNGESDEKTQLYSRIVDSSLSRAIDIVKSIMDYTRLGIRREDEKVDLPAVIAEVLAANQIRIESEGVDLLCEGPDNCSILCNFQQMFMVISNLILNALDAVAETEKPVITLKWARDAAKVSLAVLDNGCGMDDHEREHIFEAFFSTKPDRGTGLGLATVRKVVNLYNGEISVTSQPGKGSNFTIILPTFPDQA